jgi:RimJ/RimL family protein N-acetyltransferase
MPVIYLKPPTEVDYDLMFEWRNHDEVRRWAREPSRFTLEEHLKWVAALPKRVWIDLKILVAEGRGRIGVGRVDLGPERKTAEFSIYLGPEHHGKGLGAAATRALIDYAFTTYPELGILWGETHEKNEAAQRAFLRAGIRRDGIRRDEWVRFSLVRSEWTRFKPLP